MTTEQKQMPKIAVLGIAGVVWIAVGWIWPTVGTAGSVVLLLLSAALLISPSHRRSMFARLGVERSFLGLVLLSVVAGIGSWVSFGNIKPTRNTASVHAEVPARAKDGDPPTPSSTGGPVTSNTEVKQNDVDTSNDPPPKESSERTQLAQQVPWLKEVLKRCDQIRATENEAKRDVLIREVAAVLGEQMIRDMKGEINVISSVDGQASITIDIGDVQLESMPCPHAGCIKLGTKLFKQVAKFEEGQCVRVWAKLHKPVGEDAMGICSLYAGEDSRVFFAKFSDIQACK
jgi:hypothetical protein